ncbi:MAG: phosphoribosyltransferase-like protein, partial [Blastocatellia bacterium]
IIFIDELQMTAIYRDAFRRVIGPWLGASSFSIDQFLAADFAEVQRRALRDYQIVSITESFNLALLLNANDLHGLPRPFVLGLNKELARSKIRELMSDSKIKGCVVCEDVVGTGKQAGKMLQVIEDTSPPDWRILFVPLIAFESGLENIQSRYVTRTIVKPIVVLPKVRCLTGKPQPEEPELFKLIRGIVNSTAERVATPYGVADDPPSNPFGYEGSGGLIVTCHNAPNNTLPLIHHRAPTWRALFRRLHHTERSE